MSRADLNQSQIVNALRTVGATVHITNQVGQGFPDLVVGIFGKNFLIEVKNKNTRGRLTAEQEVFIDKWKGKIHIVNTVDEALRVVGVAV
ncbi:MAG: hypothetical protein HYS25_13705 [Ignavibacteriales bacterium]|nr:hypothetical protein [Ignavibacteriales bacterium]